MSYTNAALVFTVAGLDQRHNQCPAQTLNFIRFRSSHPMPMCLCFHDETASKVHLTAQRVALYVSHMVKPCIGLACCYHQRFRHLHFFSFRACTRNTSEILQLRPFPATHTHARFPPPSSFPCECHVAGNTPTRLTLWTSCLLSGLVPCLCSWTVYGSLLSLLDADSHVHMHV